MRTVSFWNKFINFIIFAFIVGISFFITNRTFLWLVTIEANQTLKVVIPIVLFLSCFFGLWVIYNYFKIFLFQQRGVQGYQLRGKITFYFLAVSIGSIAIVGGLMFYLIFLIENSFIGKESGIAESMVEDYQRLISINQNRYEKNLLEQIANNPTAFLNAFIFTNETVTFLSGTSSNIIKEIAQNREKISAYFEDPTHQFFYLQENVDKAIVNYDGMYYIDNIPDYLTISFDILHKNRESYSQFNLLKDYIQPISIVSLVIFSVPILIVAFFLSLTIAKAITTNIEEIAKGTRIIAEGNFDYRVSISSNDEIENLAKHFNQMAHRLRTANEQIKRIERLEAWHEVAKRLAHEIKNPLTPIKLSTERLLYAFEMKRDNFPQILEKTTSTVITETKRLESLVNEFSSFARLPNLKLIEEDIIGTLKDVMEFFRGAYPDFKFETKYHQNSEKIEFDKNQIKQVLINLITNSIEACQTADKFVKLSTNQKFNYLTIEIRDHSGGISDELMNKIFDPYFTTKDSGTGLGLAIAERIMLEHSGDIWFETDTEGTTFYLELPIDRGGLKNEK